MANMFFRLEGLMSHGQKPSSEELSCFLLFPFNRPVDTRTVANIGIMNTIKYDEDEMKTKVRVTDMLEEDVLALVRIGLKVVEEEQQSLGKEF
jgi:polynucleotide 5'-kinase involved in rRNA processing